MSRPFLVTALLALVAATIGLAVVSTISRARTQRTSAAAQAQVQPRASNAAAPAAAAPRLRPLTNAERSATQTTVPGRPQVSAPAPSFSIAEVPAGKTVALRSKPGGRVLAATGGTTQFGSPTALAVAARHGSWIGVTSTDLPNGQIGWVNTHSVRLATHHTHMSIRVELSKRRLELLSGRRVVRSATVGIGRPGSPTPTGRFAITDKLSGSAYGPYYGCCILALSGHQTSTPAGWQGGNRLAIHGTDDPSTIGVPSSAGCLHADAADLRVLMRRVPLGTPVFIRR